MKHWNNGVRFCQHAYSAATVKSNRHIMLNLPSFLMAMAGLLVAATAVEAAPINLKFLPVLTGEFVFFALRSYGKPPNGGFFVADFVVTKIC